MKQTIKPNKNIIIAKTLEAFTPKAKFDPFKHTYFKKNVHNQLLFMKLVQYFICKTWKNLLAHKDRLGRNRQKNLKKNQLQILMKCCWEPLNEYLPNHFCFSRGYPVTQFQALKNPLKDR